QKIVENHPQYAGYNITTGDDARSLVMAVLVANMEDSRTKDNVYINQEKLAEAKDPGLLGEAADYADEYRRVLRPILQSVEVKRHVRIWLPGPSYIRMMRDRNIIPTRPDWKNTAVKVVKGVGGFLSGLVEGFVTSIIDVFRGIYDLIKSIISTIGDLLSGELIQQAQEIYDKVVEMAANMTAEDFLKMIIGAVTAVVSEIFNDFMRRWDASNHYDKWHFRGYVVGYIVAEVVLAIFTGGTTLAVKLLGKLGKVGALLMKVFRKVLGKVDDMFDAVPGRKARRMGGKQDRDRDADAATEKAKQLPLALALSTALAETHDKADVPVTLALSSLKIAIKPQFGWIKDFEAVPLGPGRYQIYMIASRHPVGDEYTTVNPPQGEAGKPSRPESGAEMEERLLEGAVSPPSATYFGWKSGTGGGTFRGLAKELVKYAKKYKTAVATPGSSVLDEATLKFIQRKPGLKKWWDAELKGITDRMTVLRAEIRKAKGDHATLRKLRAEEQQLDEKLGGLLDWAKKPVGNKKPDLVEVFPNKKVIEVTDITQRPFDPAHNFKTEFYVEVLKELTGWTDVRGLEFARPTVVVPVK
ncbi:MAG TPA: hypothetical protein VD968_05145, partial [Pyrinomonadaceae bacterium]|nr:hypothetical protein [Pyrinomonadaceae bacterium]